MSHSTDSIEITPVNGPVHGSVRPPGSKSITNRAIVIAALAEGTSKLTGVLDSDDTRVMLESWRRLGLEVSHQPDAGIVEITGCAGRPPATSAELWLENSGTSIRFLTAACALGHGTYRLDGNKRMRERPIQDLVDGLNKLGCNVRCELDSGCPPVIVEANGLRGGQTRVAGNVSSQFLSGLLMAAPCASGDDVEIDVGNALVSQSYVDMTLSVMQAFGVTAGGQGGRYDSKEFIQILRETYIAREYDIEPDASAASYFFALAAVTGGSITVEGLSRDSLQGDVKFAVALEQMGCSVEWNANSITVTGGELQGVDIDMNDISDTAQTLACVAPFAKGPTRIRNVKHMRYKETDRVAAVVNELQRLGLSVEEHDDGMTITPGPMHAATVQTYDDHRMAMSFSLIGLRIPGVKIADPGCTEKTYPRYFEDLAHLCGQAPTGDSQ